ncbi:MAG: hypothetical protein ABSD89_01890 [Halobacteriota archaeon]|jgi:hypothetical protein
MTLVLAIKVKEGLVLAADSRMNFKGHPPRDNAIKLLPFKNHKHVAALVAGDAIISGWDKREPSELLPDLEAELPSRRLSISNFSERLLTFFKDHYENQWKYLVEKRELPEALQQNITFQVAGFDENEDDGRVYKKELFGRAKLISRSPYQLKPEFYFDRGGEILKGNTYGIACGGNCNIFEKVYGEYFSGNKDLIQKPRNPDGTCRIPDKTSLQEAKTLICSLIGRAIYSQRDVKNGEIGGKICACTITQDDGLEMFDCDDFQ